MAKLTSNGGTAATAPVRSAANNGERPGLEVKTDDKGRIFSHVRQRWLVNTPEERVRQAYVVTLHNEYGFGLEQMDEEVHVAGRGSAQARADVVLWRTALDKTDRKAPLIVVECKADNITIKAADYAQGESYALYTNAPFFVTHNNRETRFWRTRKELLPGRCEEIENIPHANAGDKEIEELIAKLKTFKEDEFADLLHSCHNVIRNRELGQFFTPRTIVEFMVRMMDPKEGETVCDPASGSGGFLIRFFDIVRQQILADADRLYREYAKELDSDGKQRSESKRAELLRKRYDVIQETIDQRKSASRTWKLSNLCIYGTDANDRMARTSKMNMILHGDGHGGVHHHNGFVNVNGVFEERFDVILTNPPFGANVEPSDVLTEEQTTIHPDKGHASLACGCRRSKAGRPMARPDEAGCRGSVGRTFERSHAGTGVKVATGPATGWPGVAHVGPKRDRWAKGDRPDEPAGFGAGPGGYACLSAGVVPRARLRPLKCGSWALWSFL